ncbi:MAG: maltose alpha-D-glucosyltransferase, partial [Burkholderiales bacterium]|nr:maltose alpha-D-glucosyltransferase [Burkholderiales bacterium]
TLWLLPFYPSPMRDDGYDIADYRNIHPDYGTMHDFRQFVREAHRRDLRVITELVINHTSDQHPWFQAARAAPADSSKRDFYVWSDDDKKFADTRIIFTDTETSNWAWDPVARQYYWHRFFLHQPDLNHNNPQVVKAVIRVMRFWFDAGVDGMRLDAIPYLCVREGTNNENLPETHAVLKQMRAALDQHYANRMFLAEANQWPEDVRDYFGNGDECHMAYHFPLMPRIYMAVAQEDRHPIVDILRQTPSIPDNCQWAIFLRNHDELTLEMVTDSERDYMYQIYATDKRMRVNVGIRRRLAPLMQNNRDTIALVNSLLMSMPGSPILYYGDEIAMGDNIYLGDRNGVRTPMQWSSDRNAGFSRADPARLFLPPIMDPVYGYEGVNVEAQSRSPSSLLNWMKRLIAVRKSYQAFGRGTLMLLRPGNRKILAYVREYGDEVILCVANLSRSAQPVELDLAVYKGLVPVELVGRTPFPPVGDLPYFLTLPGYAFYWFNLATEAAGPRWHDERLPRTELPVLVIASGAKNVTAATAHSEVLRRLLEAPARQQLEREVLPTMLSSQRWFALKGVAITGIELAHSVLFSRGDSAWLLGWATIYTAEQGSQCYFVPISLAWDSDDASGKPAATRNPYARIRMKSRTGILYDAFFDDAFCRAMVGAMHDNREIASSAGQLRFHATGVLDELAGDGDMTLRRLGIEQSNTSVVIGERLMLKGYRRLIEGKNPELEIGQFLTQTAPAVRIPPLAGALEYCEGEDKVITLAALQGYIGNQGDGWSYTLSYLERFLDARLLKDRDSRPAPDAHVIYLMLMRVLGQRTAELHAALAAPHGNPDFDPEPVSADDIRNWSAQVADDARTTLELLGQRLSGLSEAARPVADSVLGNTAALIARVEQSARTKQNPGSANPAPDAMKTRHHGDFHLGQVLIAHNDVVIVDFEGEPARPLAQRRAKHSPLRDVAGMRRSLNYAANESVLRLAADRPRDRPLLIELAADWEKQAVASFLESYGGPPDAWADEARGLLDLFTFEKALYEVRYELANRPDWVRIPLTGIAELLGLNVAINPENTTL